MEKVNKIDLSAKVAAIFKRENANEPRAIKAIQRAGIKTVCDLCCHTTQDLLTIKHIGQASVERIETYLEEYGLHLGMTAEELTAYAQEETQQPSAEAPSADAAPAGAAPATDDAPGTSEKPINEEEAGNIMVRMVEVVCKNREKQAAEERRFDLAKDIYLRELDDFTSDHERAVDAIGKADAFIEMFYKNEE